MNVRFIFCLSGLLTVGFLIAAAGANRRIGDDYKAIQGTWKVISAEDSGRKTPADVIQNVELIITKDRITYKFGEKNTEWSYRLDPTKQPKWIDLIEADETTLGIYELEGDNLKICYPEARNGERSTAFESKADSVNDVFIILKRKR